MEQIETNRSFYNTDMEHSVIGCMLISPKALKHVSSLAQEDFSDPAARVTFASIQRLVARREVVDLATVDQELSAMGHTDMTRAIVDFSQKMPSAANAEAYVRIVRDLSARRMVRAIAQEALDAIYDPGNDTDYVVERARQALRDVRATGHAWMEMPELLMTTFEHIDRVAAGEAQYIRSVTILDKLIGGFYPGELTIIGARPSVGKSAFGIDVGLSAAKSGHNVCVVSLEMYPQQFGQRLFSKGARVNGMALRTGNIDDDAWVALGETMAMYSDLPMSFIFTARYLEDIVTEARNRADEGKLDMLIVDYLQLIKTRGRFQSEHLRIGHISAELKQLSKELNIPVIALAQLSRPDKGRAFVPRMSDLKESGNIEQDADGIVLMHRAESADDPGVYSEDKPYYDALTQDGKQYITFVVDKQRQGETGRAHMIFDPAIMEYRAISR